MKSGHLTDELIVAYVTGAAREGVALAAAAHLTYCADCRRKVDAHEAIAGAILSETAFVAGRSRRSGNYAKGRAVACAGCSGGRD